MNLPMPRLLRQTLAGPRSGFLMRRHLLLWRRGQDMEGRIHHHIIVGIANAYPLDRRVQGPLVHLPIHL